MTRTWLRAPFLRIGLPFMTGVIMAFLLGALPVVSSFSMIVCIVIFLLIRNNSNPHVRHRVGIFVVVFMISCGFWIASVTAPQIHPLHYEKIEKENDLYIIKIIDFPKVKEHYVSATAEIIYSGDSTGLLAPGNGTIMIQFFRDSLARQLMTDQLLLVHSSLQTPDPPVFPEAFDYAEYLKQKGIYKILRPKIHDWKFWKKERETTMKGDLIYLREALIQKLDRYNLSKETRGIVEALVWGKTDDMDKDQIAEYSKTGVVHILAVSGMHVGLIYTLTRPLTSRMRGRRTAALRFLIPAIILWLYAAITGFSPSVSRAAVMLTLVIIAEQFDQPHESLNTLMASAIFLLIYDPAMVQSLGFQLSYLAVIGIMTLQTPIKKLFRFRIKALQQLWELCAVSIAAQIATLPICLYYFHQFPTYFLIANIIAVPLSSAALYTGLAFFSLHWWSPAAYLAMNITDTIIRMMNAIIHEIATWPSALITRISINAFEATLLFLCIILSYYLFQYRQFQLKVPIIGLICFFTISQEVKGMASSYQSRVELYKWKKKDVLCITEGNDVIVVCAHGIDSLNTNKILLQMENYFTLHGIKQVRLEMLKGKADLFIHKKIEPPDSTPLKNRE